MAAVKSDLQKLEDLLRSATNARQRKMYQALIDKARQQVKDSQSNASQSQKTQLKKLQTEKVSAIAIDKKVKKVKPSHSKARVKKKPLNLAGNDSLKIKTKTNQVKKNKRASSTRKQSRKVDGKIFQAIGLIKCIPYLEDEKLVVSMDGIKYDLKSVSPFPNQKFIKFKEELEKNGSREMFLKVYPNAIHYPDGREIRHSFSLVRSYLNQEQKPDYQEGFIFRGIWRLMPYLLTPVISVYRNIDTLATYKRLSVSAQKSFAKPHNFPVVWDAPVEPFVCNPKHQELEQPPYYFVEVRATLQDGRYKVIEMLNKPTLKIPKFIKLKGKNKRNKKYKRQ